MKNKNCTARDKDNNLKRGEYTGYSEITKKHHVSFYDGKANAFNDINAITFENSPVFETGATSAAVNELILYTDNTRKLAELRDEMYEVIAKKKYTPTAAHFDHLLIMALGSYRREFGRDVDQKNWLLTTAQKHEYCQIYANRFPEWKKERERNPQ